MNKPDLKWALCIILIMYTLLEIQKEVLMDKIIKNQSGGKALSYDQAQLFKKEAIWKNLAEITVGQATYEWLTTLSSLTSKNYMSGIKKLAELQLINLEISLQQFALLNHNAILDKIKTIRHMSECTKQARAACYISFTQFLSRRTQGVIAKAQPSKEGVSKTFYRVREKVETEAMSKLQWTNFLEELEKINKRDCLIAKIILQGGKRMNEVLTLTTKMIDFNLREVTFLQSKTKGYKKETIITYPPEIIQELKEYIGKRKGLVFITKTGKSVMPNQLATNFAKAGNLADIPFKVTPHVLRASTITYLKAAGFSDSDVMKISGHASSEMVNAYDKSDRAQNASKKVSLV